MNELELRVLRDRVVRESGPMAELEREWLCSACKGTDEKTIRKEVEEIRGKLAEWSRQFDNRDMASTAPIEAQHYLLKLRHEAAALKAQEKQAADDAFLDAKMREAGW